MPKMISKYVGIIETCVANIYNLLLISTQWQTVCRRYFQTHLLVRKLLHYDTNFTDVSGWTQAVIWTNEGRVCWRIYVSLATRSDRQYLTHWGRVTHICVGELTIIGSDNGLSPGRRQAIIWTNAGILLIRPLATNFSEILLGIQTFSFKKMHLKMSSAKWRPFVSASMCFKLIYCYYFTQMCQFVSPSWLFGCKEFTPNLQSTHKSWKLMYAHSVLQLLMHRCYSTRPSVSRVLVKCHLYWNSFI